MLDHHQANISFTFRVCCENASRVNLKVLSRTILILLRFITSSPGTDSENLDFAAPLEEHGFYGIFFFFGTPALILKTLPLSINVQRPFEDHFLQSSLRSHRNENIAICTLVAYLYCKFYLVCI